MILPVTLVTSAAAALIALWLAVRVGQVRHREGVSLGDGGNPRLIARMRAQANFVEYAPFLLLLIAAIEIATGASLWLWIAALLFVVARILHPFGMEGWGPGRGIGTGLTMLLLLVLAIAALWIAAAGAAPMPQVQAIAPA